MTQLELFPAASPRRFLIVSAIHGFMSATEALDAKPAHEARDGRTYHVCCYGPQRYMLAYVIDRQGQEVTELRAADDVAYCA